METMAPGFEALGIPGNRYYPNTIHDQNYNTAGGMDESTRRIMLRPRTLFVFHSRRTFITFWAMER